MCLFKCLAKLTRLLIKAKKFESFDRRCLEINVNLNETCEQEGSIDSGYGLGVSVLQIKNQRKKKLKILKKPLLLMWPKKVYSLALYAVLRPVSFSFLGVAFASVLSCFQFFSSPIFIFFVQNLYINFVFFFSAVGCRFWCACVKDDLFLCKRRRWQHFDVQYSICIRFFPSARVASCFESVSGF